MIAFKSHIMPIIHNTIHDDQGRYIILDCTIFEHWFTFVNIYGPNIDEQTSPFYEHVFSEINASPNDTNIIAGDFNLVLDPDKDKLGGNVELHKASRQIALNNMENYYLIYIWWNMHPEGKHLPFSKLDPKNYFLPGFLPSIKWSHWINKRVFNHSRIQNWPFKCWIPFNIRHNSKGTGYWRFDKTLLHDSTYVLKIKECITETVQDNPNTEDDLLFDIMKCNFRHTSTQYMIEKRCKDKKLLKILKGILCNYNINYK